MRLEPLSITLDGAVPIPAGALVAYLAAHPREAREFVADLADAMIQQKDVLDPDPDLEPNHGEPCSVAADECESDVCFEHVNEDGGDIQSEPHDGDDVADGCVVEDGCPRGEYSLGWNNMHNQLNLGMPSEEAEHTAPERYGKGYIRCSPDDHEDDDTEWVNEDGGNVTDEPHDATDEDTGIGDLEALGEQWGESNVNGGVYV